MFPTDKSESKSLYVSKVLEVIKNSGFNYQLTPMATIIETENISQALDLIKKSYEVLEPLSNRVYSVVKFDIRQTNENNRMQQKIESVKKHIDI
jgi:uncharacterized protein (TIGR00106 family)